MKKKKNGGEVVERGKKERKKERKKEKPKKEKKIYLFSAGPHVVLARTSS